MHKGTLLNADTHISKKLQSEQVTLNGKVRKFIRCIKHLSIPYTKIEMAKATGVSRKYLYKHSNEIEAYYSQATDPSDADIRWYESRNYHYYLNDATTPKEAMGAITGYLLKNRYGMLGHIRKQSKVIAVGSDVINLITAIKSRKSSTGTVIDSRSKSARRLLEQNKVAFVDKLFIRSNSYYAGNASKKWKVTELADQILREVVEMLFSELTKERQSAITYLVNRVTLTRTHICPKCSRLNVTLTPNLTVDPQRWFSRLLRMSFSEVRSLSLNSMLHVLTNTVGVESGHLVVSMNHASRTDPSLGRSYNVFTRFRSFERKELGFINYDMSSALQTISLQLIGSAGFPLLTQYATDTSFKRKFRNTIADDLSIEVDEVKAKLTAFANGARSGMYKHPHYKQFQEESDRLRREVLSYTAKHEPHLLKQAIKQSKKPLPEEIDWHSLDAEDRQSLARSKSSVYFFIWTWYERLIRKSMLTVLKDGIEVHDAVYSKMNVSVDLLEATIFESTGFRITIEKD